MVPFLHVWRLTIPTFGLMVAAAMVASYYVLRADLARRGIAEKDSGTAEAFIGVPCLAGIVGAKLYHVLQSPADLMAAPVRQLFSQYGFAWFGGLIGGAGAFVWLARRRKIPLLTMLDTGSPAAALGYGIGRIGCLLSGDGDYGKPTALPWGMSFPNGLVPTTQRVHPTPIYELIAACVIAWALWRLGAKQVQADKDTSGSHKTKNARNDSQTAARSGVVFAAYLIMTGAARLLVEFIRINPRSLWGLTNAQVASIASITLGVVLWVYTTRQISKTQESASHM